MLGALGRVVSFEACRQWELLSVQNTLETTLLFTFTVQKYSYPSVSKAHARCFRVCVIHQTLTWTTGSLTCAHDPSYMGGCTHQQWGQHQHFDWEKLTIFSCAPPDQIYCTVLIGTFISIISNQLKAPQGWKLWSLLPMGAIYLICKSSPYYFHLLYKSTFILLSAKCMLGLFVFP